MDQPSSEKAYLEIERAVEEMTLSIHAMAGTQAPNTFKVLGKVKGIEITVLIDTGSSHSFLSPKLVSKKGSPAGRL